MKLLDIKPNPNNPRVIKDDAFEKLCNSIKEFPKMMALRPMVVDQDNVVLGGNMRLKALQHLGFKEVPDEWVRKASELTEEEKRRFIIADNVSGGDWDWGVLQADWDLGELEDWGLDAEIEKQVDDLMENEVLHLDKSLQVLPKKEYIIIIADDGSKEWEELKTIFGCKLVRQGGCKKGTSSDKATTGLERVFDLKTFKERVLNENSVGDTK
jgi:ParB-like chromosome segregation protein Spo0J